MQQSNTTALTATTINNNTTTSNSNVATTNTANNINAVNTVKSKSLLEAGDALFKVKDYRGALLKYERALSTSPSTEDTVVCSTNSSLILLLSPSVSPSY